MSLVLARRTVHNGGRMISLSLVAALAIAGLALSWGSADARRMSMPETKNPYCDIKTYTFRNLPQQAMSLRDSKGRPIILVNTYTLADKPSYSRFLMAHECCHHSLGHVGRFSRGAGPVGPQPFYYIAPALKGMELEADCCAIKILRSKNDADGIESAEGAMKRFGSVPTGAHYPTGTERAENIAACAQAD